MPDDVTAFMEGYRDALALGPRALAALYAEPCVIARTGAVRVHATRAETERFLAEVEATARARGCTYGDIVTMDVTPLGSASALATVQWAFKGACSELLWKETFSYNLSRGEGAWTVLVETLHAA